MEPHSKHVPELIGRKVVAYSFIVVRINGDTLIKLKTP